MIIAAVPGVRGIDDACTGAWYAELRKRCPYYHTMLCLQQMESVDAPHWREISLAGNTLVVRHGAETVVRYASIPTHLPTIEGMERFQVQPFRVAAHWPRNS